MLSVIGDNDSVPATFDQLWGIPRTNRDVHAGNPWELARPIRHEIKFGGSCIKGNWKPGYVVYARAYDNPIPGWKTRNCGNLRLWDAVPINELDLQVSLHLQISSIAALNRTQVLDSLSI
jgi:hypothetical protein